MWYGIHHSAVEGKGVRQCGSEVRIRRAQVLEVLLMTAAATKRGGNDRRDARPPARTACRSSAFAEAP